MLNIPKERFRFAQSVIKGKAIKSPLIELQKAKRKLDQTPIFLKADCLQPSGSFKIRGATFCLSQLNADQRALGVVAYSTGNHAQAVALAARQLGIKATIIMSPEAPDFKVEATKSYGARVEIVSAAERKHFAEGLAKRTGAYMVPPFDHPDVITGQGTAGLEILEEITPSAIFVPVGGGGLISGIALAVKEINPSIKIIGVEPKLEDDGCRSFKSRQHLSMEKPSHSIADAVKIPSLGDLTYPLICKYVDDMITVTEEEISRATLMPLENHLIVEPAGALGIAGALVYDKFKFDKPIVCMVSGGNTTLSFLAGLQKAHH